MSKSGYSRSGLFGTINHYDSHGHDTASYAQHHKLKKKMERNLFAGFFHCVKIWAGVYMIKSYKTRF